MRPPNLGIEPSYRTTFVNIVHFSRDVDSDHRLMLLGTLKKSENVQSSSQARGPKDVGDIGLKRSLGWLGGECNTNCSARAKLT